MKRMNQIGLTVLGVLLVLTVYMTAVGEEFWGGGMYSISKDGGIPAAHGTTHNSGGTDPADDSTTLGGGVIELATLSEVDAGTDTTRAVTSYTLANTSQTMEPAFHGSTHAASSTDPAPDGTTLDGGIVELLTQAELDAGTDATRAATAYTLANSSLTFNPKDHAANHQNGGPDEIASSTPAANTIPKTGAGGTLTDWVDDSTSLLAGKSELATGAEVTTGTDATRAITPDALNGSSPTLDGANFTGIPATGVDIAEIGSATYDDLQDAINVFFSTGLMNPGTGVVSDGGGETVDVAALQGAIRSTDSHVAAYFMFDYAGASGLNIPTDTTRFVGMDYNSGTPTATVKSTDTWDDHTGFALAVVVNESGTLHITNNPQYVANGIAHILHRLYETEPIKRADRIGGLIVGETGTRNLTLSAGEVYDRVNEFTINAIDTSGADTFDAYSSSGLEFAGSSAWNNQVYDNSGTLTVLGANKHASQWWYVELDGALVMVYGTAQHNSSASAEAELVPITLPARLVESGLLVAHAIFQKGAGTYTEILSPFAVMFTAAEASDHVNLSSIGTLTHDQVETALTARVLDTGDTMTGDLILDNTGTDVNSPILYFRGDDGGVEEEATLQVLQGADPYLRISVDDDNTGPTLTGVIDIHDQVISFVNDNTTDIGSSGASRPKNIFAAGNITLGGTLSDGTASLVGGSLTSVKLGTLTGNGFVVTSGGDGTLGTDTNNYLVRPTMTAGEIVYATSSTTVNALDSGSIGMVVTSAGAGNAPSMQSLPIADIRVNSMMNGLRFLEDQNLEGRQQLNQILSAFSSQNLIDTGSTTAIYDSSGDLYQKEAFAEYGGTGSDSQVLGHTIAGTATEEEFTTTTGSSAAATSLGHGVGGYVEQVEQGFKITNTRTVTQVQFYISKTGTPGNIEARLETDAAGDASGALVNVNFTAVVAEASVGGSADWEVGAFTIPTSLTGGATQYHLVLKVGADPGEGNYYTLRGSAPPAYDDGSYKYELAGWNADVNLSDMAFKIQYTAAAQYQAKASQSFQVTSAITAASGVTLEIKKTLTPGDIWVRLETDNAGDPSGTLVWAGASGTITEASVGGGYATETATFGATGSLATGTTYHIVPQLSADPGTGEYYEFNGASAYGSGSAQYWVAAWAPDGLCPDKAFEILDDDGRAVYSTSFTATETPRDGVFVSWADLGSGSITYDLSRDGGTTYTDFTMNEIATESGSIKSYWSQARLTAQPSGGNMIMRATIAGDAEDAKLYGWCGDWNN